MQKTSVQKAVKAKHTSTGRAGGSTLDALAEVDLSFFFFLFFSLLHCHCLFPLCIFISEHCHSCSHPGEVQGSLGELGKCLFLNGSQVLIANHDLMCWEEQGNWKNWEWVSQETSAEGKNKQFHAHQLYNNHERFHISFQSATNNFHNCLLVRERNFIPGVTSVLSAHLLLYT